MNSRHKNAVASLLAVLVCLLSACGASSGGGAAASDAVTGVSTPSQVSVVTAR